MKFLKGIGGFLVTYVAYVLTITIGTDGYLSINGKKFYAFTTALVAGAAATAPDGTSTASVGSFAFTTNATGRKQLFCSDGTYWQDYYGQSHSGANLATIPTSAGNTDVYIIAPFTGKLIGAMFSCVDALTANDSNYVTFSLTNINNSNAAMLAATDANTSKATGGSAIAANTNRNLTLHGTAGNLAVTAGDRIRIRVAGTGTLNNTLTYPVVELLIQRTI